MPVARRVRPKFRRAPREAIQLTGRDVAIIKAVAEHRFLRSTHLIDLFGAGRTIRRLRALYHLGYLDRPRAQLSYFHRAGSEPLVYGLGNRGADLLAVHFGLPRAKVDWTDKNRDAGQLFIHHTLAVADAMIAIECACRGRAGRELLTQDALLEGAPASTRAKPDPFRIEATAEHEGTPVPLALVPDKAFALVRAGEAPKLLFLEADRATMPVRRGHLGATSFFRKLLTYHAYGRANGQAGQFGLGNFRVLTVTTSAERVHSLIDAARELGGGLGRFLFTDTGTLERYRGDMLALPWLNGRGERVALL